MKMEAINTAQLTGKLSKNHGLKLAMAETVSFNNLFMTIQQTSQSKLDNSAVNTNYSFDTETKDSQNLFGVNADNKSNVDDSFGSQLYNKIIDDKQPEQNSTDDNSKNFRNASSEQRQESKENSSAKNSNDRDNKTQTAEQTTAQKSEKNNAQQADAKTAADETKTELQEKLKQLAKEKKGDAVERLLAEIAELMNISVNQLKTMLKKEGVDLSQIKAALEESDSSETDKLMKQLAFKISELSTKTKAVNEKTVDSAKQAVQSNEGKQSAETTEKAVADTVEEFVIAKEEIKTDSVETKKQLNQQDTGKIAITDTELLSNQREFLSEEEFAMLREKANSQRMRKTADIPKESKQVDDTKAQVNNQGSEIMEKIKAAVAAQHLNHYQKLEGANDLSSRSKSETFMKMGIDAAQKTDNAQGTMPKFANNQNSNSFLFNQNGGQENGGAKLANLMRGSQATQSQYTSTVYKQTFEQMIKQIKILNEAGTNQIEIQLQPEHLGKVKIDLLMEKGSVIAKFVSDNEQAKQLLESNINQLKSALEEQGLKISGFEVSVNQENQYSNRGELNNRGKGRGSKGLSGSNSGAEDGINSVDATGDVNGADNYIDSRYSTVSYIA